MKRPAPPTEQQEQCAVLDWAAVMRHRFRELDLLFAIPNGARVAWKQAKVLKRTGMKSGVPDLCLPVARQGYHGLWIELKRQHSGRVSPSQRAWIGALLGAGHRVEVCKGAHAAIGVLFDYLATDPARDAVLLD